MLSRPGRTDDSLLTCPPVTPRAPTLPVRKTDLAGRGALSTCRRGVAMCGIVSFTFGSPRVTAPTSQGVLRNDRFHPDPRRVAWQLDLDPRASPAGGRGAPGVHADTDGCRRTLPSLEPRRWPRHPCRGCRPSPDLGGRARHRPGRTLIRWYRRAPRRRPDAGPD